MVGFCVSLGFGVKGLGFEGFGGLEVKGLESSVPHLIKKGTLQTSYNGDHLSINTQISRRERGTKSPNTRSALRWPPHFHKGEWRMHSGLGMQNNLKNG